MSLNSIFKVLHLEDSKDDANLIAHALKKSGMSPLIKVVETKEDFQMAIENFQPDLILSDHNLPQLTSFDAFRIFKTYQLDIPFIVVTGAVSEEFAVSIMREGIDDYILKSGLTRLEMAIQHALTKKQSEKEKKLATERLFEKNKELATLLYKCSHDLRGPLMSVLGLVNLSKNEKLSETMVTHMSLIERSIHRLDSILKNFVEFASIMQREILFSNIYFAPLIQEVLGELKKNKSDNNANFIVQITQSKEFNGNEAAIRVVLYNLLHNAIQYKKHNTLSEIKILIEHRDKNVSIRIIDDGIGIPAKIQDRVFDMFYRGNNENDGSGLGLYIVKNAIEKMKGNIIMKSESGKGTAFTIDLPDLAEEKKDLNVTQLN